MAIDDNTTYGLTGAQIKELPAKIDAVKGLAKVLTADDYNYPANNPTSVAVWLLDAGIYKVPKDFPIRVGQNTGISDSFGDRILIACKNNQLPAVSYLISRNLGTGLGIESWQAGVSYPSQTNYPSLVLTSDHIANSLDSTWTTRPLSAAQGKVLNDKIGGDLSNLTTTDKSSLINAINEVAGAGGGGGITELTSADYNYPVNNPTSVALWLLEPGTYSITSGTVYRFNATANSRTAAGTEAIIIGGSEDSGTIYRTMTVLYMFGGTKGIIAYTEYSASDPSSATVNVVRDILTGENVVQSTGTSGTNVMSQNAVTSMIFPSYPSNGIRIGNNSSLSGTPVVIGAQTSASGADCVSVGAFNECAGAGGVALGPLSKASAQASVAFAFGQATVQGQFDIGTSWKWSSGGYNNSQYRLLTGLYDGQSAHDAATVGQITPLSGSSAPTTATVGRLGQIFVDSTNTDAYMCVAVDDVTPSYTWKKITA